MARKGILSTDTTGTPKKTAGKPPAPPRRGAVGALQSSLTKLQESAVQDIDPAVIDDAGLEDRLGIDAAAQKQLKNSIETYGQQVPVLLRPHPKRPGRYEIVYGRRRVQALKDLGQPVKAMIRQLDDEALIMAQGQENTTRQDLSFIEKASFAAQLEDMGFDRATICDALSIDMPMASRMLKVGQAFDIKVLRKIGPAPSIGRDRWMKLAKLLENDAARVQTMPVMETPDFVRAKSDDRFELAMKRAVKAVTSKKEPKQTPKPQPVKSADGTVLGDLRSNAKGVTLTIVSRNAAGFEQWFEENAQALITDLHDQWQKDRSEENQEQ